MPPSPPPSSSTRLTLWSATASGRLRRRRAPRCSTGPSPPPSGQRITGARCSPNARVLLRLDRYADALDFLAAADRAALDADTVRRLILLDAQAAAGAGDPDTAIEAYTRYLVAGRGRRGNRPPPPGPAAGRGRAARGGRERLPRRRRRPRRHGARAGGSPPQPCAPPGGSEPRRGGGGPLPAPLRYLPLGLRPHRCPPPIGRDRLRRRRCRPRRTVLAAAHAGLPLALARRRRLRGPPGARDSGESPRRRHSALPPVPLGGGAQPLRAASRAPAHPGGCCGLALLPGRTR